MAMEEERHHGGERESEWRAHLNNLHQGDDEGVEEDND